MVHLRETILSLLLGLLLMGLLVLLPWFHLGLDLDFWSGLFWLLPFFVLFLALARPEKPIYSHFLFMLSPMPLLILHPELLGPKIYSSLDGVLGLFLIVLTYALFLRSLGGRKRVALGDGAASQGARKPKQGLKSGLFFICFFFLPISALLGPLWLLEDAAFQTAFLLVFLTLALAFIMAFFWLPRLYLLLFDSPERLAHRRMAKKKVRRKRKWPYWVVGLSFLLVLGLEL